MILPRLAGPHVPALFRHRRFRAPGLCRDRAHSRRHALQAAARAAAALRGGAAARRRKIADRARRSAPAERDPSRHQAEQHHVPRQRRGGADRLRPVAPQPSAGPVAGGIPPALRHRALYGAGAAVGRARRSAQRSVFARRAALFLHHRRAAVRRERDAARDAAAAVARSASAAPAARRTIRPGCRRSCCAAWRSSRSGAIRPRRNWRSISAIPTRSG